MSSIPTSFDPIGSFIKVPSGFKLGKALVVNTNYQVRFKIPNLVYSDYVYHFSGYTTDSACFMFGASINAYDSIWQGDGRLVWSKHVCSISSNKPIEVILGRDNESYYNGVSLGIMGNDLTNTCENHPDLIFNIFDVRNSGLRPAAKDSKFYFLRIYKNGKIIHHFVPVLELSSGQGCVLEVFSQTVYRNILTGDCGVEF